MTIAEALEVLNIATQPSTAGKLDRLDYARCEEALQVLTAATKPRDQAPLVPSPGKA
jgi:hypothetical protein